ncbi:MAG TPA: cell division protein FtsB [Steroidobacteraceae bacterium]|jgi:cell division protein FtsB|nr:cell division protein FtsB [Steroidobacteraceae bacterium]
MKWLAAALLAALLLLQYRLWLSNDGVRDVLRLKDAVATQQAENAQLTERNRQLAAEVRDLKQGYAALEERARADLGMIAGNETYYQIAPPASSTAASTSASAPPTAPPTAPSDVARALARAAAPAR